MEDQTVEILNYFLKGGSISLTKSNTKEVLDLCPKLRNLGILTFSGKSSYHLNINNRKLLKKLIELNSFEKFLTWLDENNTDEEMNTDSKTTSSQRKIFISHSKKDAEMVEHIIEMLEAIGVKSDLIFCSSFEGYNVGLGDDFLQRIKVELSSDVLVIFILSEHFFKSPICLCEMGATWVRTKEHVPILVPPFDYKDMKGVIPPTHIGMKINEVEKYNSLKERIESFLNIDSVSHSVWERKRNRIIGTLNLLINDYENPINTGSPELKISKDSKKEAPSDYEGKIIGLLSNGEVYELYEEEVTLQIKRLANNNYPDDYSMQVYLIKNQEEAVRSLKKSNFPDIPRDIYEKIRLRALRDYPNDFEMQFYIVENQVNDYRELKN